MILPVCRAVRRPCLMMARSACCYRRSFSRGTTSAGRFMTLMPAFARLPFLARSDEPEMIAPAWPMRPGRCGLAGDEIQRPALLTFSSRIRRLLSSVPPISPIITSGGLVICLEGREAVDEVGADQGITADPDARRLPIPCVESCG